MSVVPPVMIDLLKGINEENLPHTALIFPPIRGQGVAAGNSVSYDADPAETLPCRFIEVKQPTHTETLSNRRTVVLLCTVAFAFGVELEPDTRIRVTRENDVVEGKIVGKASHYTMTKYYCEIK